MDGEYYEIDLTNLDWFIRESGVSYEDRQIKGSKEILYSFPNIIDTKYDGQGNNKYMPQHPGDYYYRIASPYDGGDEWQDGVLAINYRGYLDATPYDESSRSMEAR